MNNKKIRTRFAPSPTGYLHVGGLRTALYSYLFAKQSGGDFILRIEDTDQERLVSGAKEKLIKILKDFGLDYDEGPDKSSVFGPYIQSQRLNLYKKYAQQLIDNGDAYYCFCSPDRLREMRENQQKNHQPPKYDRHCLNLSIDEINAKIKSGVPYVIRFKIPEGETDFTDLIRGKITVKNEILDDQIIMKSDGYPTYHLAVVVDDFLMRISHVIRGEEWISSTPKHILLYKALGFSLPKFAHLPLLLNPDKSKLSKRQGDVAVEDYLAKGYLKSALLNFVALLGWNPGNNKELFTLNELEQKFSFNKVQKGGAVFDIVKLKWFNSQYIKKMYPEVLAQHVEVFLRNQKYFVKNKFVLSKLVTLFQDRLQTFAEIGELAEFLYKLPEYGRGLLIPKKSDEEKTSYVLRKTNSALKDYIKEFKLKKNFFNKENIITYLENIREQLALTRSEMYWPIRVAVSGMKNSPDLFGIMEVLGAEETINRIQIAIAKIDKI